VHARGGARTSKQAVSQCNCFARASQRQRMAVGVCGMSAGAATASTSGAVLGGCTGALLGGPAPARGRQQRGAVAAGACSQRVFAGAATRRRTRRRGGGWAPSGWGGGTGPALPVNPGPKLIHVS
jgi:hypothetical protein